MSFLFRLLEIELKNTLIYIARYPLNFISGAVILSFFFIGLFFGASYLVGGVNFFQPGRVESSLISFIAWTLTITCLSALSNDIYHEATQGTLEHVISSKRSFLLIMLVRLVITVILTFVLNACIFLILSLVTGSRFQLSWAFLIPIFLIGFSACGLGLFLGGITLIYKQTQGFINLIQFVILPAFFISYSGLSGLALYLISSLPCISGVELARIILTSPHANLPNNFWFFAALSNSVLWLVLGALMFQLCLNYTKRKGLLNEY